LDYYHIDAFTTELFKGNSAGVIICRTDDIVDVQKQKLANEFKHSETAFILINDSHILLRWFTPTTEVDLCGHATIAAAHALWESGAVSISKKIIFETKSGNLSAKYIDGMIELDFPQQKIEECEPNEIVNNAFGIAPIFTGRNSKRYLLEIEKANELREIEPDFELLKKADLGAFMITCKSDLPDYDFLSRFFAPYVGINEDPVTGSAHCYLAPYWKKKLNKNILIGFQESRRTGIVECELFKQDRIKLRGSAKTLFNTELRI
jgi:PhzF family phenazine biosynthesis protein